MTPEANRLRDVLWSLRREFGLEADIDRFFTIVTRDRLTEDQMNNLIVSYPLRVPEDFKSALLARMQQSVRRFWLYRKTRKGRHLILQDILFLENVARHRFAGCRLVEDEVVGFVLELKPEHLKKGKK